MQTLQQVGGSLGLAVMVTVAGTATRQAAADGVAGPPLLVAGMTAAFVAAALVGVLSFVVALTFAGRRVRADLAQERKVCKEKGRPAAWQDLVRRSRQGRVRMTVLQESEVAEAARFGRTESNELRRRGQDGPGRRASRLRRRPPQRRARVEEDGESYVVEWTLELLDEVPPPTLSNQLRQQRPLLSLLASNGALR